MFTILGLRLMLIFFGCGQSFNLPKGPTEE